jgi:hypothetical protein
MVVMVNFFTIELLYWGSCAALSRYHKERIDKRRVALPAMSITFRSH